MGTEKGSLQLNDALPPTPAILAHPVGWGEVHRVCNHLPEPLESVHPPPGGVRGGGCITLSFFLSLLLPGALGYSNLQHLRTSLSLHRADASSRLVAGNVLAQDGLGFHQALPVCVEQARVGPRTRTQLGLGPSLGLGLVRPRTRTRTSPSPSYIRRSRKNFK